MRQRLIFLDLDGVLNDHSINRESGSCSIGAEQMHCFNSLVRGTGAKVVIASAWRYLILNGDMSLSGFHSMLRTHGWRKSTQIIGTIGPDQSPESANRGALIRKWFEEWPSFRHGTDLYVAIDDMDLGYTQHGIPFVRCIPDLGFTAENLAQARKILELKEM